MTRPFYLEEMIGFDTINRPLESWYSFISRLIRANVLSDKEIRDQLPLDWVRLAFNPLDLLEHDPIRLGPYGGSWPDADLKFRPSEWHPFPELSSTPPECLRGCPRCLADGFHSHAMQGDLIKLCPVHCEALDFRCPHCDSPMLWVSRSVSRSAFFCPTGCTLSQGSHSGLVLPDEAEMSVALGEQRTYVQLLRKAITFISGPVHIAYPTYQRSAPSHLRSLPSQGLVPALIHSLQKIGSKLPEFAPYHEQSDGRWSFTAKPCEWGQADVHGEEQLESYRRSFRRGVYRTSLPIVNCAGFQIWLAGSESANGNWHKGALEKGNLCTVFVLPSYFLTNNELAGLRRLLARRINIEIAFAHYHNFLIELLEHARLRRISLDQLEEPSPALNISETFDAVVETSCGRWHLSGFTRSDDDSRGAWLDFCEPAEVSSEVIHIMRRDGPPR